MITKRAKLVYQLVFAFWALVLVWQILEHYRVEKALRETVIRRARDITGTMGVVVHSQRRFGGIVSKPRIESALKELLQSDDLKSVALLNATGEVVVEAGEPVVLGSEGIPRQRHALGGCQSDGN